MRRWGALMRSFFSSKRDRDDIQAREDVRALDAISSDELKREAESRRQGLEQILREHDLQLSVTLGRRVRHDGKS